MNRDFDSSASNREMSESYSGEQSMIDWIRGLKAGDEEAAMEIWGRFYHRIRSYAARRLGNFLSPDQDEEDLVQSAFRSVFDGARRGQFEGVETGEDFWQLLVMVASAKIANAQRSRGRRPEVGESALYRRTDLSTADPLASVPDPLASVPDRPAPTEDLDDLASECEELLVGLEPKLRRVALLRLAGYSNQEIASLIERSVKTVEHYFRMIRLRWDGV